jgi:hypothetical protein
VLALVVLTHLALDLGFGSFILLGPPDPEPLRTFIGGVEPDIRERVTAARAQVNLVAVTADQSSQ